MYSVGLRQFIMCLCIVANNVVGYKSKVRERMTVRLHPGTFSFDELVRSGLFVDKSLLINDFIESECKVNVITRPPKWGKSVNIDMVKRFFEVEVDDMGIQIINAHRKNHLLFEGGEIVLHNTTKRLNPLKIAKFSKAMKKLGMLPVIRLTLSSAKGKNFRAVEDKLQKELKNAYLSHNYIRIYLTKGNSMLNETEKQLLAKYFSNKKLTTIEVENGLLHLSSILFEHFRRKVIILVDEKDASINHAVENFGENDEETKNVLTLLRNMFKGIINNVYMERSLITGTLPFTEDSLFVNTSEICIGSVLDEDYSDYFGFTETEVDEVLGNMLPNDTGRDKMKYWYNGFHHGNKTLYNPLDIMGYGANNGRLLDYWADSGRVKSLDEFLVTDEAQEDLLKLLEDEGTIKSLYNYDGPGDKVEGFHIYFNIFFRLMVHHGYLNAFSHERGKDYLLRVPNQEVRNLFVDFKTKWFCSKHDIVLSDLYDFVGCLVTRQLSDIKDPLKMIFENFKNASLNKEEDYHNIMSNILYRLLNHNFVITNKNYEYGKLYHMIIPRSRFQGHIAIIIEYAVLDQSVNSTRPLFVQLQALAQGIIDHIDSRVYGPMVVHYTYVDKVITVGIAFSDTNLELAYKVYKQQ